MRTCPPSKMILAQRQALYVPKVCGVKKGAPDVAGSCDAQFLKKMLSPPFFPALPFQDRQQPLALPHMREGRLGRLSADRF